MAFNTGNTELDNLLNFLEVNFGIVTPQTDVDRWLADLEGTGTRPRDFDALRKDIITFRVGEDNLRNWAVENGVSEQDLDATVKALMDNETTFKAVRTGTFQVPLETTEGAPDAENKAEEGVGGVGDDEDTQLTILTGEDMKWYFDSNQGKWYVSYGLGTGNALVFEADPDQMDALFGTDMRPESFQRITFNELVSQEGFVFAGNVSEMAGTGAFEDEVEKVISLALDEGKLPSWMEGSAEALDLLFIATSENKGNEWLFDQFSKLPEFKQRFPGIDNLIKEGNLTLVEGVANFLQFEASVRQAVAAVGDDIDIVTPEIVGSLLAKGYNVNAVVDTIKSFERIRNFEPALAAFNQILAINGYTPLTSESDIFDFVEGRAPQEVYDLYEATSLQEAATQAGLGDIFTAEDAVETALAGAYNLESATQAMQQAAKLLLRLRQEVALDKFGLNQDDLLDISLGLTPSSGVSEAEVFDNINRATSAAQASLKQRSQPFSSFTNTGIKQASSLSTLRQEA